MNPDITGGTGPLTTPGTSSPMEVTGTATQGSASGRTVSSHAESSRQTPRHQRRYRHHGEHRHRGPYDPGTHKKRSWAEKVTGLYSQQVRPLREALDKIGTVEDRFTRSQALCFQEATRECNNLLQMLNFLEEDEHEKACRLLQKYALLAGKGRDYNANLKLLEWLLPRYLDCGDSELDKKVGEVVGMALDRLVATVLYEDREGSANRSHARLRLFELCKGCDYKCLKWMGMKRKEQFLAEMVKNHKRSKQLGTLDKLLAAVPYGELAADSVKQHENPVIPWDARLTWLMAAQYTGQISKDWIKQELDKIDDEVRIFLPDCNVAKSYLLRKDDFLPIYELSEDDNAFGKLQELVTDIEEYGHNITDDKTRRLLRSDVERSLAKLLLEDGDIDLARTHLEKAVEWDGLYNIKSLKSWVLQTRALRLGFGEQAHSCQEQHAIEEEIKRLLPEQDNYEGVRLELADCYKFLGRLDEAEKALQAYKGWNQRGVDLRRACILVARCRFSEAEALLKPLLDSRTVKRHHAHLSYAICLKDWVAKGYDESQQSGQVYLTEREKEKNAKHALEHFTSAIRLGSESWRSAWDGLGHMCEVLRNDRILNFHDQRSWLPNALRECTSWRDAASKAFALAKARDPGEAARMQEGVRRTIHPESYGVAMEWQGSTSRSGR